MSYPGRWSVPITPDRRIAHLRPAWRKKQKRTSKPELFMPLWVPPVLSLLFYLMTHGDDPEIENIGI